MEGYNEAVKSGKAAALTPGNTLKEPRLVVKAPFLALPFSGGMTATFGGPKINAKGQVLNAEQQPVPGLYAAGNAIGGLFYWNYIVGISADGRGYFRPPCRSGCCRPRQSEGFQEGLMHLREMRSAG